MEIAPHIHHIPGVMANPYLLVDPGGLTLIDAGLPGSQGKILGYIKALGFKPADLKRIIITHSDFDHVAGLAALQKASGARVYASSIEAQAIEAGKPSRQIRPSNPFRRTLMTILTRIARQTPVRVDERLADGQVLPLLGGLTVLETPGHTPGHLSFFAPAAGVLFCGDSLVVVKGELVPSRPGITWDRAAADASVRKQAALGARVVGSGHGPVVADAAAKFPVV